MNASDKFVINGGKKLFGKIKVDGSKNATLPILAAAIMCKEEIVLHNVPRFSDIFNMIKILEDCGAKVEWIRKHSLKINAKKADKFSIDKELAESIRSSIFMLGSLVARFKNAVLPQPGGCKIGQRPIDLHIKGLKDLGAEVDERFGVVNCSAENLKSGITVLDFPSVGATENLIMAAVLSEGETTIINGAKEPEIVELANFINKMGGKVEGAGTSVIKIRGVKKLHGTEFSIMGDRIIAGTLLILTAMTGGNVEICGIKAEYLYSLISKLSQNCCKFKIKNDRIVLTARGRLKAISKIETMPYPGFPTDLQSQMLALQTISRGSSIITENVFESRFKVAPELAKMGAKIVVKDKSAFISGVSKLYGTNIYAEDLRGGISLVMAALVAEGESVIHDVHYIDRGYYKIEQSLKSLGADIKRITQ